MKLTKLTEIRTIFNNFNNLGASELPPQDEENAERNDSLFKTFEELLHLQEVTNEEVEILREEVANLKEKIDLIDVELIRSKQEAKKIGKSIEKLQSLNVSRIKVDANERDKTRISKNRAKVFIMKQLISMRVKSSSILLVSNEGEVKFTKLNKNNPKEVNCENVWNAINECSNCNAEWQKLFN